MSSPRETLLCRYSYDPLDRVIGHMPADELKHQRFYCKSRLATEIQGAIRYSIVQQGDQLLAQRQNEGAALNTTLLATDQQRSVLHTIKATNQRQPISYSPYGHRRPENGLLSLLGFNGEQPDSVTGHYLLGNGYRAFNAVLMRLNSPDSSSPFGKGGLNPYAYCLGDPINRADPNGHSSFFTWLRAKWTGKLAHNGGILNIAPNASTRKAMKAQVRLGKLDELIEQERTQKHNMRINKITEDRIQLNDKKKISSLSTEESIRYHTQASTIDFSSQYFSYLELKTISIDSSKNRYLPTLTDKINSQSLLHSLLHSTEPKFVTQKDLADYLKNDIEQYYKEIKSIRNPSLISYKKERDTLYNNFFT